MADLRIVDAPEIPTNSITGGEKIPTGGNGNYSISLNSVANYTKTKKDLADNTSVDNKVNSVRQQLNTHTQNLSNPHQVTKGQIGLGNVDNTADLDKPVSNSTQAAIISAVTPKANKADVYAKSETYTKQESSDLVNNSISTALTPVNTSLDLAKRGVINRYDAALTYNSGERVVLTNGDIVKSTINGNTNNPNVDIIGWVSVNDATQLKYKLKPDLFESTIAAKLSEYVSTADFGAIGDGTVHTVQEWINSGKYANLAAIQLKYPHVTSETDSIDWAACQAAINYVGAGGSVLFNKTAQNTYIINKPLKYHNGQRWVGCGGVDVLGLGTEIKLVADATSVAEPKTPTVTTYGFNPIGIYFNAQNFGDAGLSLYNTSYANVDQCAANCAKVNGAAILLDSDVSKQCYFNKINAPRTFASGVGGTGIRFTRGANANQVFGGKCGSSKSGMEFLSLSAGNLIIGTDFEDNAVKHVFLDAPGNVFIGTHMETAPIGYDITANGSETRRIATTFAATVTTYVKDDSGGITQTVAHESYPSGLAELITGSSKQTTQYFTTSATQNNDFKLLLGTENLVINFFRNTNSTSASKRITFFKGDGTATESFRFDIATAEFQCGDIIQKSATNIQRKMIRAAAIPTTGTFSAGDKVMRTNPNTTNSVVTEWTCVAGGTPGTWVATAWYTGRGTTAQRPTGLTSSDVGVQYFDNTLAAAGKPVWWTGSAWVDATGVIV